MQMQLHTLSEALFESYCFRHGLPLSWIPTESHIRTPDCSVTFAGNTVIAEVKQFDPTDDEEHLQKQLDAEGFTPAFGGKLASEPVRALKTG